MHIDNLVYLIIMNRREVLKTLSFGAVGLLTSTRLFGKNKKVKKTLVISTWFNQKSANVRAWEILSKNGNALDAVEQGVMVSENDVQNCCVGLGANPDRDGIVTLDACIMDHQHQIGCVAALERIKNPISVARAVMEKTPHVFLVGQGAQDFAIAQGFPLAEQVLSKNAKENYDKWLKESKYEPIPNIESGQHGPMYNDIEIANPYNHDTIGMIALDTFGNLSGACTTSGMGFKMRGRVGDSPIIGAGLYVDNEVGAATATGQGEEVIRICGSHLVVEFMRQGCSPEKACKKAVERIQTKTKKDLAKLQIGFIAINTFGDYGGYALQSGFDFTLHNADMQNEKIVAKSII